MSAEDNASFNASVFRDLNQLVDKWFDTIGALAPEETQRDLIVAASCICYATVLLMHNRPAIRHDPEGARDAFLRMCAGNYDLVAEKADQLGPLN